MPFEILRQDITKMHVAAIVNSTSAHPSMGGGSDFEIHQAAGDELFKERETFGVLEEGRAILTKGYQLPAPYVIHVVGPVYLGGQHEEHGRLRQTYLSALSLARYHQLESIAFPLISSGTYQFPRGEALDVALSAIKTFLDEHEMMIYLLVYDDASYQVSLERFISVKNYLEASPSDSLFAAQNLSERLSVSNLSHESDASIRSEKRSLDDLDLELDETFAESLFRLIDERGLNDVDVYKKANIDRKLFSKIKSNPHHQPSKLTALAFALALELNLDQTKDLLNKAGYSLSPSSKFDKIIAYFIEEETFDLFEINQVLFAFEQKTLGGLE